MRPKIGFQKRDFTSKPVKQEPAHLPGPFFAALDMDVKKFQWAIFANPGEIGGPVICRVDGEVNARWVCAALNGAWNSEQNIERGRLAMETPYKKIP